MRVIAGTAKGTRLAPVPRGVRPVSDMAREGLFASLGPDVIDAEVLDLFAGTGALGIEALSRGAARATFVDASAAAVEAIRDNLARTHLLERADVVRAQVPRWVAGDAPLGFDLVLADPPYDVTGTDLEPWLEVLAARLPASAIIVLTRSKRDDTVVVPLDWVLARRLEYGDTVVLIHRRQPAA